MVMVSASSRPGYRKRAVERDSDERMSAFGGALRSTPHGSQCAPEIDMDGQSTAAVAGARA
jgi:hypothetical protein